MASEDQHFPDFAIFLAQKGYGYTSPNPMVGAVLVHKGRIIGQGWHEQFGQAHAEVNCIRSVRAEDRHLIPESVLYVSLEPCSHYGKTPPCTRLIEENRIPRVVIGYKDIFEKVDGSGIRYLRERGVEVECLQSPQAFEINRFFFKAHMKKRPFITLKWAETLDGYIGTGSGERALISGHAVQNWVHHQRRGHQAILAGAATIMKDDPLLDVRKSGYADRLMKVIWDKDGDMHPGYRIFRSSRPVIIFTSETAVLRDRFSGFGQVTIMEAEEPDFLQITLAALYDMNVISLYVEGGYQVLSSFIRGGVYDEIHRVTTPVILPDMKVPAPALPHDIELARSFNLGRDTVNILVKV